MCIYERICRKNKCMCIYIYIYMQNDYACTQTPKVYAELCRYTFINVQYAERAFYIHQSGAAKMWDPSYDRLNARPRGSNRVFDEPMIKILSSMIAGCGSAVCAKEPGTTETFCRIGAFKEGVSTSGIQNKIVLDSKTTSTTATTTTTRTCLRHVARHRRHWWT